ncbi:MAG: MDR family MFS transporter [Vicinamibacterales bacterium]|jgi:EmrB/QacA subfamily drug resistance transporter|nr:MDR family MFS transporter [Vicinamibacterales bacterium]MDP6609742.1 MDR family MFS transporter [Vicinamibacterales bacterium]
MKITRRMVATCGVLGGNFLAAIESTIVAAAMPTVVTQLGGLEDYSWVFAAYLLAATVTVPLWGKLSDLHGRRAFYLGAIAFFLGGSVLCGLAWSMPSLIAFRLIQGIGAGGILPLGMTIIGDLYTIRERGRMQGLFSGVWGVASIAGPLVGGYLTDSLSWRWVFYLNVPFAFIAAAAVGVALGGQRRTSTARIDYRGALFLSGAVTILLLALGQTGGDRLVGPLGLGLMFAGAAVLGAAFVRVERRAAEPLVPVELLRDKVVGPAMMSGFLVGVAMFGAISFVPLFVQAALGGTATQAGSALTPLLLGWVLTSIVTGRVLLKVGYRRLVCGGLSLVSLGFVLLSRADSGSSLWAVRGALALMGMGMGMGMLTLVLAVQNAVPREQLGTATSLGHFTRSIGGAIGVAVMGAIVVTALPVGRDASPAEMAAALQRVFVFGACVAAVAVVSTVRFPKGLPQERPVADGGVVSGPGTATPRTPPA